MSLVIRLNGRTVAPESACLSPLDHGFLYGNGLFETMRATENRILGLAEHLGRLIAGAAVLGLRVPPLELLAREVIATLDEAQEPDAYVRVTASHGPGAPAPDPSTCDAPTVVVIVKPFVPGPERWATEGIRAVTASIRRSASSPLTRIKSLNYLECILAKQAAREADADEAIFLDTEGYVAEATAWNLFFVEAGRLRTPEEAGPILPGITRALVLQLAADRGLERESGRYAPQRLVAAEEAFLTNSLYGVVPLGSLGGLGIGTGVPGPITRNLAGDYETLRLGR